MKRATSAPFACNARTDFGEAYSSNPLERTAANLECGILGADTTLLPVSWNINSQLDNEIGRGITRHSYQGKTRLSPSECGRSLVT